MESVGACNFEILAEVSNNGSPSSFTVRMEYLFQFWYCKLCVENRWGREAESIACWFLFFDIALFVGGWRVVGWGRKSYLGPAEISSFSSWDLSWRIKHDSFWLAVSTEYFRILFSWAIVVSDFLPLKIHEHLVLPMSSVTFTANSQADNHFYKHIHLLQIL